MKNIVLGVKIDTISKNEAINFLSQRILTSRQTLVVTPNPELIVDAQKDSKLMEVLNSADLSIPDGQGVLIASKVLHKNLRIKEKIPGADIAEELLKIAGEKKWRIGIVGARKGVIKEIEIVIRELIARFPGLEVKAMEISKDWDRERLDLVFACQMNGVREKWMAENSGRVNASVFIGVGGALDFVAGVTRRAPVLMQKLGLEWFWRLIIKPKTHLKRIWKAVFVFLWLVIKERLQILRDQS